MTSQATTHEEYIAELPENRKQVVPLEIYPAGPSLQP